MEQGEDPLVLRLRGEITACDVEILEAFNRRLELVAALHRHKLARGYPLVDPTREGALLDALTEANGGPLSDDGVRELLAGILALAKHEAARINAEDARDDG